MGTYSNRSHPIPEASSNPSSHFAWFYPGSFFSDTTSSTTRGAQNYPQEVLDIPPLYSIPRPEDEGLNITPLCPIPPPADPAKENNSRSKRPKVNKQKSSVHGPGQAAPKASKPRQPKKSSPRKSKAQTTTEVRREKKNVDINVDRTSFDFSGVPSPFCSCTGMPRVCYKWGAGGWQSSCCTTNISEYPLPISSTKPGVRLAGRKMSNGAYGKLLMKLAAEGYDLSHAVDLKTHWARHGTNKFVTIK